ncbi:hypothetical protein FOL47_009597 [Perkinsus chesapeaki]|uniref:Uncharacterized protein n=1 Tax=Perkinsus chesapeaki TaxID=330153 RepID=A0A7J6MTG7_PERCH|nr:hypothetical protein FOL47_009597 [Perkinsus chesapeaki]
MGTRYPYQVRVVTAARHEMYVIDVLLDERCWRRLTPYEVFPHREIRWFGDIDKPLTSVIPIVPGVFGVIIRDESTMSSKATCSIRLADSRFRQIGSCTTEVAMDGKEAYHMRIMDGPGDTLYFVRMDTSFKEQAKFTERDYNEELPRIKSSDSIISDVCPDDPKRLAVYTVHWYCPSQ